MTVEGFAACNCYKQGKTIEPPCSKYLHFDKDGISLMIPHQQYVKHSKYFNKMDKLLNYLVENACEHDRMIDMEVRVSSVAKMSEFKRVIDNLGGADKFPIISKYFPFDNEQPLPAKFALKALQELRYAESKAVLFSILSGGIEKGNLITVGEYFKWLFDAARILLEASIETRNPVLWNITEEVYTEMQS
jgi:hypothetical protein